MNNVREKILWGVLRKRIGKDKPYVIAIGGGIAKTSTKVALGEVLKKAFPGEVLVGYGNLNSYLGVPLAALGFKIDFHKQRLGILGWLIVLIRAYFKGVLSKLPKYLVLEYGTDSPGDIAKLTKALRPDMALITIVTEAHVSNYKNMDEVAKDESALTSSLSSEGIAIFNASDPYLETHKKSLKTKKIFTVETRLELIARNFAIKAAEELGVDKAIAEEVLSKPISAEGRFQAKRLKKFYLIDDSYNANPASMEAALNVLAKLPGRKVAILGTMLELGENSVSLHKSVGKKAGSVAEAVFAVGEQSENYAPVKHFKNSEEASKEIFPYLKEGDSILVKGSRGVRMEKIVEAIEKHGI